MRRLFSFSNVFWNIKFTYANEALSNQIGTDLHTFPEIWPLDEGRFTILALFRWHISVKCFHWSNIRHLFILSLHKSENTGKWQKKSIFWMSFMNKWYVNQAMNNIWTTPSVKILRLQSGIKLESLVDKSSWSEDFWLWEWDMYCKIPVFRNENKTLILIFCV